MTADAPDTRTPLLTWRIDIPLVNNRFVLWDSVKVTLISAGIMWALVAILSLAADGEPLLLPLGFVAVVTAIVWVLLLLACLILLNRWGFTNTLYEEGAGYESGEREKRVNRLLSGFGLLGSLSGSTGGLGSALLARSREDGFYPWTDVHRLISHPGPRVISLRNSWRVVYRLYCTPDNFEQALALCERKVGEAAAYRTAHPIVKPPLPWGRWALWALLCIGAFVAAMAWDGSRSDELGLPLVAAALALLAAGVLDGPLRRLCGLVALAVAVWFVYATMADGLRPVLPDFVAAGLSSPPLYSGEELPFAVSILGGAVIALAGGWSAFAPPRRASGR